MNSIQKIQLAKALVQHAPGHFGEPVMECAEQREERAADQHVMKMRHHEVRVVHLQVERNRRKHHARQATHHKDEDEAEHEVHGCRHT